MTANSRHILILPCDQRMKERTNMLTQGATDET